ncbi:hypothetical protein SAMN05421823_104497 [Catalinimonas alkaloidigena]|uniref:DUF3368 domain-containing protein n=1 Tax=Catalinimonas alkaloidigena TaxID=1075417 RepID=A0A1G9HQ37_9BACT|nr:DUF3368 domain-containing protein [Catalinimonas alkaloidigena]SDL14834.1 hypothetical protein SAMN05421823_104497 [Catalinimonas alkaloidigena]
MRLHIIADASCLIVLDRIGQLDLLRDLFLPTNGGDKASAILTTPEVQAEFGQSLPDWLQIAAVHDKAQQQVLAGMLDPGEASAIALALEMESPLLILDEKKGRREAQRLQLPIMGTLRVLQLAHQAGLVPSLTSLIGELEKAGFRLSKRVIEELLNENRNK